QERLAPRAGRGVLRRRRLLVRQPTLESARWIDVDAEEHVGVLGAAVLGALPEVEARVLGLEPEAVRASRDQVGLPGESGDPETVTDVRRLEGQVDRAG